METLCDKPNCQCPALKEVWLIAVADCGIVAHVRAFADAKAAITALDAYLAENNGYSGPADIQAIRRWLREYGENLSVEITCQRWGEGATGRVNRPTQQKGHTNGQDQVV
jgi:hypothetical protein